MTFGQFARAKRFLVGYTQDEVADWMRISKSTYSLLENDNRRWTLAHLISFALAFNIKASVLLYQYEEWQGGNTTNDSRS